MTSNSGLALFCVGGMVAMVASVTPTAAQELGSVLREQEIAWSTGGFGGALDDSDRFGSALAALGDLDGDGIRDLAVGAPEDDDGGTNRGALWILLLEPAGSVRAETKISSTQGGFPGGLSSSDRFGCAVAWLGDLDGDGNPEVAVGAEQDDDGGTNRGALWILSLDPAGHVLAAHKVSHGNGGFTGSLRDGDRFGCALATLDDMNGDGRSELAVGAEGDRDGGTGRGAVWVLFLDASAAVTSHAKISSTSGGFAGPLDNDDLFGSAVARLGDLDGDGLAELVVGAEQDDDGFANCGAAWVLFLNADGSVRAHAKLSRASGLPFVSHDHFGASVAAPGDVDGDGTDDLAVGAPLDDNGGLNFGAVWILLLNPDASLKGYRKISATSGGLLRPLVANDFFGGALAELGDLDGDRMLDLAVGVDGRDVGGANRGASRILFLQSAEVSVLVVRNGLGINPVILSADDAPVVGKVWEVTVDCTGFRRGLVVHVVVAAPLDGPVLGGLGQVLVDLQQARFALASAQHFGTPTVLREQVPPSQALAGLEFYSQALVTGALGAKLTNALDGEVLPR